VYRCVRSCIDRPGPAVFSLLNPESSGKAFLAVKSYPHHSPWFTRDGGVSARQNPQPFSISSDRIHFGYGLFSLFTRPFLFGGNGKPTHCPPCRCVLGPHFSPDAIRPSVPFPFFSLVSLHLGFGLPSRAMNLSSLLGSAVYTCITIFAQIFNRLLSFSFFSVRFSSYSYLPLTPQCLFF